MDIDIEVLLELEKELSHSKIAKKFGVTKNTITGRIYRYKHRNNKPFRKQRTKVLQVSVKKDDGCRDGISILELTADTCRFMIGSHKYCGDMVVKKNGYCATHHAKMHTGKGARL